MEFRNPEKKRVNPSLNEKALQIMALPFEQFCKESFVDLNKTFKTEIPEDSHYEVYRTLFDALQTVVVEDEMNSPVEIILKSDGLMVRVCPSHTGAFDEANELAKKLHLSVDRISHTLCKDCDQTERERAGAAISYIRANTNKSIPVAHFPPANNSATPTNISITRTGPILALPDLEE